MPQVLRGTLVPGDILMTKFKLSLTHMAISAGSAVVGNFKTANYVHAQIVTNVDHGPWVAESHDPGITLERPTDPATVFRLDPNVSDFLPVDAANVALELAGRQSPNDSWAQYNKARAIGSLLTTSTVNQRVRDELAAIERGTITGRAKKIFCSQFVCLCYQVACLRLGDAVPVVFPIDAKSMEPAFMVSFLRRNPNCWNEIGEYDGVN